MWWGCKVGQQFYSVLKSVHRQFCLVLQKKKLYLPLVLPDLIEKKCWGILDHVMSHFLRDIRMCSVVHGPCGVRLGGVNGIFFSFHKIFLRCKRGSFKEMFDILFSMIKTHLTQGSWAKAILWRGSRFFYDISLTILKFKNKIMRGFYMTSCTRSIFCQDLC